MSYFNQKRQTKKAYQPELLELKTQGFEINQTLLQESSIRNNTLTTEQLRDLGVRNRIIRACSIPSVIRWNNCLIWHLGRNSWKVYEEKQVN